ncbi:MAG TPA: hypothetical protein VLH75_11840 [Longimicrobiales bacterium]|nr:hypothetical protein [Longimicrobiales bacterium]
MCAMIPPRLIPCLSLLLFGCVTATPWAVNRPAPLSSKQVRCEELRATREATLYDAIEVSRPTFVHPRSAGREGPVLYVDNIPTAEFDAIHSIPLSDVVEVAFMSGPDATTRYGTGHVGGALLVRTFRGRSGNRCGGD